MSSLRRCASVMWWGACLLTLVLSGCAGPGQATQPTATTPGPTATPRGVVVPPIHTIDLGNFQATVVFPTAHGLVLFGNPGTVGQPIGPAGAYALYYYDTATKTVSVIATPTPTAAGVQRGIRIAQAAGDWVVYYIGDAGDFNWEIWALNLVTHQRRLVASAAAEQTPLAFLNLFFTDGTSMVWAHAVLVNGKRQNVLARYDLASGSSQVLLTTQADTTALAPEGLVNGTLVFYEQQVATATPCQVNCTLPDESAWLWQLGEPAPKQIVADAGSDALNFTLNDQYVVWDQLHHLSLNLYDRATGKETDGFAGPCIRPQLVVDRPYVVCVDWDSQSYRLVRVPSGEDATFYDGQEGEGSIFTANGRAYWVATPKGSPYGSQIDYFDVPTS